MSKTGIRYAGLARRLTHLMGRYRVYVLFGLIVLTALFRDAAYWSNYVLAVLWGLFFLLPLWVYAGSNTSHPTIRLVSYLVCLLATLAAVVYGIVLLTKGQDAGTWTRDVAGWR